MPMEPTKSEEVDLFFIYKKLKATYTNWLLGLHRFITKFWYVIVLVLVVSYLLGLYLEKNKEVDKEIHMIVQINFDAADYVYDGVFQLRKKIVEGDARTLAELKNYHDDLFKIQKIEITPIVDVKDLDNNMDPNNRNVDTFLEQSKYEEDLLLSDMFISQYKLHKIVITASSGVNSSVSEAILQFINNNKEYIEIVNLGVKNIETQIAETYESVEEIDNLMKAYASVLAEEQNSGQIYVNTSSNVNLHFLIQEKTSLLQKVQETEADLVRAKKGIITLVNRPMVIKASSFLNRTSILFPVIFFFFFVVIVYLVGLFKRLGEKNKALQQA